MLSALDVVHTVVVVDERRGGISSIKHPLVCTRLRKTHKIKQVKLRSMMCGVKTKSRHKLEVEQIIKARSEKFGIFWGILVLFGMADHREETGNEG